MNKRFLLMIVTLFVSVSYVRAQAPGVTHIWPDAGINEQSITAHIYGNFATAPVLSVKLVKTSYPDINGTSINQVSGEYLTCSFNLTNDSTGLYGLVVTNTFGEDTLPGCFTVYSALDTPYIWVKTTVGSGSNMYGVAVGDGNGDGEIEVYGASMDKNIYQFKWDGTSWVKTTMGSGGHYMRGVAVGDGNGDGEIEVYGANYDSNIYQFKWNGKGWVKTTVGSGVNYMYGVAVGDGNGDGEIEVYGASMDKNIYQFKWNGKGWVKTTVGSGGSYMKGVAVGDGNGDGEIEVYGANYDSNIYQFKWNGKGWVKTTVGSGGNRMYGVAVGDGNGDGEIEVYGACQDYHIYQFKWNGKGWVKTTVGSGGDDMYGVAVGDGNGDGEIEVYGASWDNKIYQFKWDGKGWVKITVGSGGGGMLGVAVGDGNGDGEIEVYGANFDSNIYQFKPAFLPDIVLYPTTYDFGMVPLGDSLDWEGLVIKNAGVDTLFVDSIIADTAAYIITDPAFPDTILASDSTLVTVRFKALAEGVIPGTLGVYSDDPDEGTLYVTLTGEGYIPPQDIELSDTTHDFGLVLLGDSLDWEGLVIKNTGMLDLIVGGITSDTTAYIVVSPSFPDTIVPDDSILVPVRFKPFDEGIVTGRLTIFSNDPDESPVNVTLTGQGYLIEPEIVLSDTAHDFGGVAVGDSLDWQWLVIKNAGFDTLFVGNITSDTTAYIVADPTFPDIILPSDSTLVTVRFKPPIVNTITGTLNVYSNDPDRPVVGVFLTGVGLVGVEETPSELPKVFSISQNTPNPFTRSTTIMYQLPVACKAVLKVYDITGSLIKTLVNSNKEPGYYTTEWNAADYPTGIYFLKFTAGDFIKTKKLVLMR